MDDITLRAWLKVDLGIIKQNAREIHRLIPENTKLMAILKGDAYFHGAVALAKALGEIYPDDWIGVACLSEALEMREAGVTQNILILGWTSVTQIGILHEKNLTQTLVSDEYANDLIEEAKKQGIRVKCHGKIDTGMTRSGLLSDDEHYQQTIQRYIELYHTPELQITGIYTHFSSSSSLEEEDMAYTRMQVERFIRVIDGIRAEIPDVGLVRCCNSEALINYPEYAFDMVRAGKAIYGLVQEESKMRRADLRTSCVLKARVALVKDVPAGSSVSYGRRGVTERDSRLAVITIGGADGYPTSLTNVAPVCIRGHICRNIGFICMDMCMVDVTDFPDIKAGDEAVLLGKDGENEVPYELIKEHYGLIMPAFLNGLRSRIEHIYTDSSL